MGTSQERIESTLTSVRYVREFFDPALCPHDLASALRVVVPPSETQRWDQRALFELGAIYVNGKRCSANVALTVPCRVEVFVPKTNHPILKGVASLGSRHILYEDDDLLAVWKEAGLPSLPTRDQQAVNLKTAVEQYLGHRAHMPSRLDTSACGVVLVSKNVRSHRPIQHAFEFGRVQKWYLLEVSAKPGWRSVGVRAAIGRDESHAILRAVGGAGARDARSEFFALHPGATIILARPRTGRTHQLRIHTAYLDCPIVGDNFYGGVIASELRLLAFHFSLTHPRTGAQVAITAPLDLTPPWARGAYEAAKQFIEESADYVKTSGQGAGIACQNG